MTWFDECLRSFMEKLEKTGLSLTLGRQIQEKNCPRKQNIF